MARGKAKAAEKKEKATRTVKAKRWTVSEAFAAIRSGDLEARADIGRRFPLFATASAEEILSAVTLMTARQVESRLRGDSDDSGDGEEEEKPKRGKGKSKATEKGKGKGKGRGKKASEPEPEEDDEDEDDELSELFDEEDEDDEDD